MPPSPRRADGIWQRRGAGRVRPRRRRPGRFDHRRPVEPWLTRIAVNRAIDLLRAERRLTGASELADQAVFDAPPPDEDLHRALAPLDPERRTVVALHYRLDYTTPQIAEPLDAPLGTVNSRLARARRDLRLQLEAPHV